MGRDTILTVMELGPGKGPGNASVESAGNPEDGLAAGLWRWGRNLTHVWGCRIGVLLPDGSRSLVSRWT